MQLHRAYLGACVEGLENGVGGVGAVELLEKLTVLQMLQAELCRAVKPGD